MGSGPAQVDIHVGNRLRLRRRQLGMSQERLAYGLGLTFQQIQKYERGANRISASKLYEAARCLKVPVSHFFDGLAHPATPAGDAYAIAWSGMVEELLAEPNGKALAEASLSIRRRSVRKGLADPDSPQKLQSAYAASSALYFRGQPAFDDILAEIARWAPKL